MPDSNFDKRRADAGLWDHRGMLKSVLQGLSDGVVVVDRNGRVLISNQSAERIIGFGAKDIPPSEWSRSYGCFLPDMVTPYPSEELPLARAMRGEQIRDAVIFIRNPQMPSGAWISVNSSPLYNESSGLRGGLIVFKDITARRQAHDVAQRLSKAVERTADCVFITDLSGKIEYVNPAFEVTTGYSRSEALGQRPSILKSGMHSPEYYENLWNTIKAGDVQRGSVINRKKNGELFYAEQTITPIKDADGNLTHFVSVVKDVTELKRAEEREVEMRLAREIQQKLYPSEPPQVEGMEIAGAAHPADETGGDYFDFIPMGDGCIGIAIGDVSGHGFGSALLMAETRAYLRSLARTISDVGEILGLVNQFLNADTGEEGLFVTLMLARVDTKRRSFVYASAGHTPGYLLDEAGSVKKELSATGLPLGPFPEGVYQTSPEIHLSAGDLIVMITDGLTETQDREGNFFGEKRVLQLVAAQRKMKSASMVNNLFAVAEDHASGHPQLDDITAVICKILA